MGTLRKEDGTAGDVAAIEAARQELETRLGGELDVALDHAHGEARATAWFRGERLAARGATHAEAWSELEVRLVGSAPSLSAYVDVQEYVTSVRSLELVDGVVRVGAPTQRFCYRLGRREALTRLDLSATPFLMLLDDETGRDATLFRLPSGQALLFLEVPEVFARGDAEPTLDVPCLVLDDDGRATGERVLTLRTTTFTSLEALVAEARAHGAVLVRNPESGLLALAVGDDAGARLCEYLFSDAHVDRAAMEGFAPRDPAAPARSWKDHLACPGCRADLPNPDEAPLACAGCGRSFEVGATGAPHLILPEDTPEELEQDEEWIPNSPPKVLHYFLCKYPRGLVLDSGAGSNPLRAPNLVNLEVFPFESTVVVGSGERLPFREGTFDAAMSSAVLEHVPDPPAYCREFGRVLRAGGEGRIDSAFLQPYHACPDHYYGTTLSGLRLASRELAEVAAGNSDSQSPFVALQVWLHAYASALPEEHRERFYGSTVAEICGLPPGRGPSHVRVPPEAANRLASGVYRHVRKP